MHVCKLTVRLQDSGNYLPDLVLHCSSFSAVSNEGSTIFTP